ncbi:MAG TPA: hypothetical protein VF701_12660 [Thermoanaerobaculia bacterium]
MRKKMIPMLVTMLVLVVGLTACQSRTEQATDTAYTTTVDTDTAMVQTETTATTTVYQETDTSVQTDTFGGMSTDTSMTDTSGTSGTSGTTNTY